MRNAFVVYNGITGAVGNMIQTDDPAIIAANIPDGCKTLPTVVRDINEIDRVAIEAKKADVIIVKADSPIV